MFLAEKGRRKDAGPAGPCGPHCPTCSPPRPQAETRWWDRIATSSRLGPNGGTTSPRPRGGTCWWDHDATSSRWYTSQTIYDDLVLLFYDGSFVFVIILRAKAPSLVTYDEARNFVIESACSLTKFESVTTESSLMNTFLVVAPPNAGALPTPSTARRRITAEAFRSTHGQLLSHPNGECVARCLLSVR